MITTISATEFKNKLSDVLNSVYYNRVTFIVEKHGKPMVKIIPINKSPNDGISLDDLIKKYNIKR